MPAPVSMYQRRRRRRQAHESGTTTANLTPYAVPLGTMLRPAPFPRAGGDIVPLTMQDFKRRSRLRRRRRARLA